MCIRDSTGTVPTTSGVSFAISPNTTQDSIPFEIQSDGSITATSWSITAAGVTTIASLTTGAISASTISATGAVNLTSTLSVTGISTFNGNLIANGADNQVNNATIDLKDGTEVSPSLKFESSTGGAYAVSDVLSVADSTVGGGGGSGFQFTVSKVGFVDTVVVDTPGRNF